MKTSEAEYCKMDNTHELNWRIEKPQGLRSCLPFGGCTHGVMSILVSKNVMA